jgi:von Willebrand factor type A domain
MRRCRLAVGALGVLALLAPPVARAQTQPAPSKDAAVILILDASKSMKDDDGTGRPKFQAAKEALNTLVDELPDDAKVGLRVYGSEVSGTGRRAGCADTKLVAPVAPLDRAGLKEQIAGLQPRGFTPIGASLQGAAKDLGSAKQKTVVLVSDGGDNCKPPDPCAVARQISRGGVDLKIQAVGFQVAVCACHRVAGAEVRRRGLLRLPARRSGPGPGGRARGGLWRAASAFARLAQRQLRLGRSRSEAPRRARVSCRCRYATSRRHSSSSAAVAARSLLLPSRS